MIDDAYCTNKNHQLLSKMLIEPTNMEKHMFNIIFFYFNEVSIKKCYFKTMKPKSI